MKTPRNATATDALLAEPARRSRTRTPRARPPRDHRRPRCVRRTSGAAPTSRAARRRSPRPARRGRPAAPGASAAAVVTPTPITNDAMIVRLITTRLASGTVRPNDGSTSSSTRASPMPSPSPTSDPARPTMNASASTEPTICAAGAADRAQQPELARALRDEDRERVEDDEPADEQADPGEAEQRGVEEPEQLLDRFRGLGHDLGRRAGPPRRRAARVSAARHRAQSAPSSTTTLIASSPSSPNSRCAVRRSKAANVNGPRSVRSPNVKMPTSRKSLPRPEEQDPDLVPDRVTQPPRGRVVHRDLAVACRAPARRRCATARRRAWSPTRSRRSARPRSSTVSPSGSTNSREALHEPVGRRRRPGIGRTVGDARTRGAADGRGPARRRRTRPRGARRGRCPRRSGRTRTSNERRSVSVRT